MIQQIDITSYKSCRSVSLDLNQSIVALIGKNGVGKTNLLRAIEFFSSIAQSSTPVDLNPQAVKGDSAAATIIFQLDGETFEYRIAESTLPHGTSAHPLPCLAESLRSKGESGGQQILSRTGQRVELIGIEKELQVNPRVPAIPAILSLLPQGPTPTALLQRVRQLFSGVRYYQLENPAVGTSLILEQQFEKWAQNYETDGTLTNSVLMRLIYAFARNRELFLEILSILGSNGLGLIDLIDVRTIDIPSKMPQPNDDHKIERNIIYSVLFFPGQNHAGHGQGFQFTDLSAGTCRMIRLVVSLLFDQRSVMLVEQPEDSVNLAVLHKLINILRVYSTNKQVVLTTHSPDLLDVLDPSEVRLVHATNGDTQVRGLGTSDLGHARNYLKQEGSLSEFIEALE